MKEDCKVRWKDKEKLAKAVQALVDAETMHFHDDKGREAATYHIAAQGVAIAVGWAAGLNNSSDVSAIIEALVQIAAQAQSLLLDTIYEHTVGLSVVRAGEQKDPLMGPVKGDA